MLSTCQQKSFVQFVVMEKQAQSSSVLGGIETQIWIITDVLSSLW